MSDPTKIIVIGNADAAHALKRLLSPRTVPCPTCGAATGERCTEQGATLVTHHAQRVALAKKVPAVPFGETLNSTDKALIVYYSYVMLSDACSAHAEVMGLGKSTSEEIQRYFAQQAIAELRKDGLLK